MLKKETWQTAATVVVGFGIAFLIVGTSQTFQSCIGEHYHHEPSETFQKSVAQFLVMLKFGSGCTGEFVHKNADSIIALFTVILGIATWLLWRATRALVIEGREASAKLWTTAEKQRAISEDTAVRQLRAYVFLTQSKVTGIDNLQKIVAVIYFKNSGQTPAYNVTNNLNISTRALDDTDFSLSEGAPSIGSLGPGVTGHAIIDLSPINEATRDGILNGHVLLMIHGRITYTDAFGIIRRTNYRATALRDGGFSLTTEGNEAD